MKPSGMKSYLQSKKSPLAGHVDDIYTAANKWRVDPRLIVAIAGAETSFGLAGGGPSVFNAWGIGPGRSYASWADGINAAAKLLKEGYIGQGLRTIPQIQRKWAPLGAGNDPRNLNSAWTRNVSAIYEELGGASRHVNAGWRHASSPVTKDPEWGGLSLQPAGRPPGLPEPTLQGLVSGDNSIKDLLWSMVREPAEAVKKVGQQAAGAMGAVDLGGQVSTGDHLSPKMTRLAQEFGLSITSGFRSVAKQTQLYAGRSGAGTVAAPGSSYHNMGRAIDVDVTDAAMKFVAYARKHPQQFREVFYDGGRGPSIYIKNGVLYKGRILGGHSDHVHIAR